MSEFVVRIDLERLARYGDGASLSDVLHALADRAPYTVNSDGVGHVWTKNYANVGTYRVEEIEPEAPTHPCATQVRKA